MCLFPLAQAQVVRGFGHQAKHHYDVLSFLAKREVEDVRAALPPKGKGKGKDDRGGGGGWN